MKKFIPFHLNKAWKVLGGTSRSQAAVMTLQPGDAEGGPQNRHPKSDQWMWVQSGSGLAIIEGQRTTLRAGVLLLIKKGERHEIRARGRRPLKTLNFYAPPVY